jgi:3-hydroxybutyryl-CoA dehydrogenase
VKLSRDTIVGVVGAGAMGSGIAQIAAAYGHKVLLFDQDASALDRAMIAIEKNLARGVEKKRITRDEADAIKSRISTAGWEIDGDASYKDLASAGLIIEAVVEKLEVKRALFAALDKVVSADTILATNTSSLSVTAIASASTLPERVLGVHFFNPATVLPLVEIIPGLATSAEVTTSVQALVDAWGKKTVVASDTPGFIVNRIARPFYGEALRIYEEGIADMATIDWAMKEIGGFKMGPFELMDFIGNDVNYAVTTSVFEAFYHDSRYRPALTQKRLVEAGLYGRKRGRGYYDYAEGAERPSPNRDEEAGQAIVDRVLAMLVNAAVDALHAGVASAADIDTAMKKGVNYPMGLLEWGDEIGAPRILARLEHLQAEYGEERYRPSLLLRRCVRERRPLHA